MSEKAWDQSPLHEKEVNYELGEKDERDSCREIITDNEVVDSLAVEDGGRYVVELEEALMSNLKKETEF